MKKICLSLIIVLLCFPLMVNAQTLDEYIAEAEAKLEEERAATEKKQMTEEEKKEALAEKDAVTKDISNLETQIDTLENDIKSHAML